jgi:hypothetical protein
MGTTNDANNNSNNTNNTNNTTTLSFPPIYIRKKGSCSNDYRIQNSGKNLNYFYDPLRHITVLETFPITGKKEIVNVGEVCDTKVTKGIQEPMPIYVEDRYNTTTITNHPGDKDDVVRVVEPSFGTTDELALKKIDITRQYYTSERGSACCVPIDDPRTKQQQQQRTTTTTGTTAPPTTTGETNDRTTTTSAPSVPSWNQTLLLGRSHSKIRYSKGAGGRGHNLKNGLEANHFFSSFYAMEPFPPYKTVARSGKFCLGMDDTKDDRTRGRMETAAADHHHPHPYLHMQRETLKIGTAEEYPKCPRIHFVSGMTEKADDPSQVIISYGVNDCVSKFVILDKQPILRLLFTPYDLIS